VTILQSQVYSAEVTAPHKRCVALSEVSANVKTPFYLIVTTQGMLGAMVVFASVTRCVNQNLEASIAKKENLEMSARTMAQTINV
jgi:hypothetical protein